MVKRFFSRSRLKSKFDFRFVDPVAQEIVSVKSFDGQWEVSTFRTIGRTVKDLFVDWDFDRDDRSRVTQ